MALPNVKSGQTATFQKDDANASSFEVTIPSGLTNDNTLIVIFACDGNRTITMTADMDAQLPNIQNTVSLRAAYKKIDGTEGSAVTVTTSGNERACAVAYEIENASDPDVDPPTQSDTDGISATPDPTTHTPAGGAKDFLWLAAVGVDRDRTIDSFPTNMDTGSVQLNVNGGTANSCSIGSDTHQLNAASFNPDTFGISALDGWVSLTLSIFPFTVVLPVGTGAPELELFSMTAVGVMQPSGAATPEMGTMTMTAVALMQPSGIGAPTIEAMDMVASGLQKFLGTGAPTIEAMDMVASGLQKFLGTGAPTMAALEMVANGLQKFLGAGAPSFEDLVMAAVGTADVPPVGTASPTLEQMDMVSSGVQKFLATGSPSLEDLVMATVGTAETLPVGTAAPTLEEIVMNAVGAGPAVTGFMLPRIRRRRRPGY